MSYSKKNIWAKIGSVLLIVALSVTCSALIFRNTSILEDDGMPIGVNKNNLVHTIEEYSFEEGNTGVGITSKINYNGSVKVNGKYNNAEEPLVYNLGTVTIETADYYTLSGAKGASDSTYYIMASYEDSTGVTQVLYSDFITEMTSPEIIPEGTQVTISIVIFSGVEFDNFTFKPTFVAGTTAGKF